MNGPFLVQPNQPRDRFYRGGHRIREFRGTAASGNHVPEDWVGSTTALFGETERGLTVIGDDLLTDLVAADPQGWLGPDHVERWGSSTALLVKLLDAGERLPIHCHPDRSFASTHLGSEFGKTEAWIAVEDVTARVGFNRDVSVDEVAQWVSLQDTRAMLGALAEVSISRGSSIVIPAGVPHASGEGAFVIELQEPTDFSVLLEWRGFDIDGPVAGHLGLGFGVALGCLDVTAWSPQRLSTLVAPAGPLSPAANAYFRAERHDGVSELDPGFSIVVVVAGHGALGGDEIRAGQTWVVPFSAGTLQLTGGAEIVRCRPPL